MNWRTAEERGDTPQGMAERDVDRLKYTVCLELELLPGRLRHIGLAPEDNATLVAVNGQTWGLDIKQPNIPAAAR